MPSGPESILEQATKVTPEELAASICSMISEVGKMWAHNPEAAMGGIERMLIEVPLATYFEIPEVAEKVATHGTPFMAIGGFVIYATRVQMLRSAWQKEQAEKRQGSAMNQRGTLTQQPKTESPKPGRVNAEEFYRPATDSDLNAQRGWLGSSPVGASDYDAMRAEATQHAMANPGSIGTKPLYEE